jgi:hypothetical protein
MGLRDVRSAQLPLDQPDPNFREPHVRISAAGQLETNYRSNKPPTLRELKHAVSFQNPRSGMVQPRTGTPPDAGACHVAGSLLCYLIVQPFIPAVIIAVAAVATKRPQNWLARRLRSQTAAVGVLLMAGLIVIPLSLLITYLVRQIIASIHGWPHGGADPIRPLNGEKPLSAGILEKRHSMPTS